MKNAGRFLLVCLCILMLQDASGQSMMENDSSVNRLTNRMLNPLSNAKIERDLGSDSELKKKKRRKKKKKKRGGRGGEQSDFGMLLSFDYMFAVGKGVGFTPFFTLGKENATIRFGLHITTPVTFTEDEYGYAFSNMTDPSQITIPVKYRYMMIALGVDYKRFFFNGSPADGGLYGAAGLGATYIPLTAKADGYNETLYYTTFTEKQRYFQPNLRFGLGYDLWLSSFGLTFEGLLVLPANQVMGMEMEIQLPPYVSLSIGAKFGI